MKYTIYLRTNTINGKHYVGQTNDFRRRERQWRYLKWRYANKYISNDREQYGLDNFSTEILAEVDTREEAWNLEQYYIEHYNTIYPNGYNLSKGGASGANGVIPSEETRKKMSENNSKYWLGKQLAEETKKKMSEAMKGENNPMFGKHLSDETRKKMSEAIPKKKVYQYSLDGELVKVWESTNECGRNGFNQGNVSKCCNGIYKQYKGFIWSYKPL